MNIPFNGTFSGSEPNVGSFIVSTFADTQETYTNVDLCNGEHIEFECSIVDGYDEVFSKLRQHGFTIAGFQTAKVIPFKRPEAA
jgi:hypothetical protein